MMVLPVDADRGSRQESMHETRRSLELFPSDGSRKQRCHCVKPIALSFTDDLSVLSLRLAVRVSTISWSPKAKGFRVMHEAPSRD